MAYSSSFGSQNRSRSSFRNSSVLNRPPLNSNKPDFYSRASPSPPKIYSPDNKPLLLPSRQFNVSDPPKTYASREPFLAPKYSQVPLSRPIDNLLSKYPSSLSYYSGSAMGSSAGKQIPRPLPLSVTSGITGSHSSHSSSSNDGYHSGLSVKEQSVPDSTANLRPRSGSRSRQSNALDRNTNATRPLPDLPGNTSSKSSQNKASTLPPSGNALRPHTELSPSPPTRQANGKLANGTLSVSSSNATVASGTPFSVSTRSRTSSTSSLSSGPQANGTNGASNHSGPSNSSGISSSTAGSKTNGVANGKPPSGISAGWSMRVGSAAPGPETRNHEHSVEREERSSASPSSNSSTPQHPGLNGTSASESKATRPDLTHNYSNSSLRAIDDDDSPYPRRRVQSPSPAHTSNRSKETSKSPDVRVARPSNGTTRASPQYSRERLEDRALPSNHRDDDDDDDDDDPEALDQVQEHRIYPQAQRSRELSPLVFLKEKDRQSLERAGRCGLRNLGNTCFMNSVLQCLSHTRPLLEFCLSQSFEKELNNDSKMHGTLFVAFAEVLKHLWAREDSMPVNPGELKSRLDRYTPRFQGYSQHDAQELLRYLLEGLHEDLNRKRGKKRQPIDEREYDKLESEKKKAFYAWNHYLKFDDSFIVDLFVGQLKSTLKFQQCNHSSVTFDPFWDLSLPIPRSGYSYKPSLDQCMEGLMAEEHLVGAEKPMCDQCKQRRDCTKRFSIQRFPKILVIHLKRFSGEGYRSSKMSGLVEFPIERFDTSKYSASDDSLGPGGRRIYSLFAVSNHSGFTNFGHYTANCRHPYNRGDWHYFDDSSVRSASSQGAVSAEAYVLFYELIE